MQKHEILPVLYDLSITIGGQLNLKSLLTRTLQRLLFHTSFSAGFICLDVPEKEHSILDTPIRIDGAVGDFEIINCIGQTINIPTQLLYENSVSEGEKKETLSRFYLTRNKFETYLRLPLDQKDFILLLSKIKPETNLDLPLILQPVLSQLAKAIKLCRTNDIHEAQAQAERNQLAKSLSHIESQYESLIELSPIGVCIIRNVNMFQGNSTFLKLFGYDDINELTGINILNLIAPNKRGEVDEIRRRRLDGLMAPDTYESIGLRRNGSQFPIMISAKKVETENGTLTFTFIVDLTEQKRSEQKLKAVNDMLRLILETAPLRIFWKDTESRYLGCNHTFAKDAGKLNPEELIGLDDRQLSWREQAEAYIRDDLQVMKSNLPKLNFEEPQTTPNGNKIWLRSSKVPLVSSNGEVMGLLGIYDDITEQKKADAKLYHLAYFDSLTDLPNRRLLQDRLQQAMSASVRNNSFGAILLLDLDDFKLLNDSKGHNIGDKLLIEVGNKLQENIRDGSTIARIGGDEFVVILEGLTDSDAATRAESTAAQIRSSLSETFLIDSFEIKTTPSIGIIIFQGFGESLETLLKHAETAMYQAKKAGRNTIRFFDPKMQSELEEKLLLIEDLNEALGKDQIVLYYQKQVDSDGRPIGAEVLIRWLHPTRGLVPPVQFIPLAEEIGTIIPIGFYVLTSACQQLKKWQQNHLTRDLVLAVNVSAKQFRREDFVDQVNRVLIETGAKPSHLKLELTESIVLDNVEDTIQKMRSLKLTGISFSMDDFGTGYSSLQYLKRLPLDQIKIDQSFVREITTDINDAAIVQTIIAMSDALGLNVIAEGVETKEQRDFLDKHGCHNFQGYFFGKPIPLPAFEAQLNEPS